MTCQYRHFEGHIAFLYDLDTSRLWPSFLWCQTAVGQFSESWHTSTTTTSSQSFSADDDDVDCWLLAFPLSATAICDRFIKKYKYGVII